MKVLTFSKAFDQIKKGEVNKVKFELMAALKVKSLKSFYNRKKGYPEARLSEAKKVEKVFAKYGITDIWSEEEI